MHKGQLMVMRNAYSGGRVVVYDGGGGEGSQRIRYWAGGDVHVTKPHAFTWIDGSDFDPKDLIPRDFRGCLPEWSYVERSTSGSPVLYGINNPFELAKLPNLIKLPMEEWRSHITNGKKDRFTIEGVEPVACKIDCRGNVYLEENKIQISYQTTWSKIEVCLNSSATGMAFDPASGRNAIQEEAIAALTKFANRYREKMGMPKLELE